MSAYEIPIPVHEHAPNSGNYRDIPIDAGDPRHGEPLVEARAFGIAGESYYARTDGENAPYGKAVPGSMSRLWCRQSIASMLARANEALAPYGAEIFLWDGYRTLACQRSLWDFFWARFREASPGDGDEEIAEQVRRYVSDPRFFEPGDPHTWPAHATGAALDLTLRDTRSGTLLDMGTHFDDMTPVSHSGYFERLFQQGAIGADDARLRNRRLLHWAMREQGFTNYAHEFWHFDFGNQMYVMMRDHAGEGGPAAAWYGYVPAPANGSN